MVLILTDLHAFMSDEKLKAEELLKKEPSAVFLLGDICDIDVEWIRNIFKGKIYYLYGNHDEYGDYDYIDGVENFHGKIIAAENTEFLGIEGCVRYKISGVAHTQEEILKLVKTLPKCDILLSHEGPETEFHKTIAHQGYQGINKYLQEKKPRMLIHGHRHRNQVYLCEGVLCVSLYKCATYDTDTYTLTRIF